MSHYYQGAQGWTAGKSKDGMGGMSKDGMSGMGNMANPWAGAAVLSQEYNS